MLDEDIPIYDGTTDAATGAESSEETAASITLVHRAEAAEEERLNLREISQFWLEEPTVQHQDPEVVKEMEIEYQLEESCALLLRNVAAQAGRREEPERRLSKMEKTLRSVVSKNLKPKPIVKRWRRDMVFRIMEKLEKYEGQRKPGMIDPPTDP